MAVKYSKVRDFGGKGRKTRKIDNQMWTLVGKHSLKSKAKKSAENWRKKGYKARVDKQGKMYRVYKHTK